MGPKTKINSDLSTIKATVKRFLSSLLKSSMLNAFCISCSRSFFGKAKSALLPVECLFCPTMCWEVVPSDKLLPLPLYKDPAITLVCWHPEYQYNNASSLSARYPHTHILLPPSLLKHPPRSPYSPPQIQSCPWLPWLPQELINPSTEGLFIPWKLSGGFFGGLGLGWAHWWWGGEDEGFGWGREMDRVRQGGSLSLYSTTCPAEADGVTPPCHCGRLLSIAAIRRQVSRRFGVAVFGKGYKAKMLGGRKRSVP